MGAPTVPEMLQSEIETLPGEIAGDVLDFVLFLKARRREEACLWEQVEETRSYRAQHPEDVVTVTAEEWDALTARPEGGA